MYFLFLTTNHSLPFRRSHIVLVFWLSDTGGEKTAINSTVTTTISNNF